MGAGLRPTGKPVDEPPIPKTKRAAFLSQLAQFLNICEERRKEL